MGQDTKIQWTSQHGCHEAQVGPFRIGVAWGTIQGEQWTCWFEGRKLTGTHSDLDLAKQVTISYARAQFRKALAMLQPEGAAPVAALDVDEIVAVLDTAWLVWRGDNSNMPGEAEAACVARLHRSQAEAVVALLKELTREP